MSQEILRFTSHYSIFNQLAPFRSNSFLIYHRFLFLQVVFEKFFNFSFQPLQQFIKQPFVALNTQRILNISLFFIFFKLKIELFFDFFLNQFYQASRWPVIRRNRIIIYHRFLFLQAAFWKFFHFFNQLHADDRFKQLC